MRAPKSGDLRDLTVKELIERTRLLYERAVYGGEIDVLPEAERELDKVEADLALGRGRILHVRFLEERREDPRELPLFERAAVLYRMLGDAGGEAEALFWLGCFHQTVRDDMDIALPLLERSQALAIQVGDLGVQAEVLRHLGIAEHAAGRLDTATEHLENSTRLRRELGHPAGVAANQVGLIYLLAG